MQHTAQPPAFFDSFFVGRAGWRMRQRDHDGGWIADRKLSIAGGGWEFRLLIVAGLDDPTSSREWVGSAWVDAAALDRYDGSFDEVTEKTVRAEKLLALIEEVLHSPSAWKAQALVGELRGSDLNFLRKALGLPRATVDKTRANIIRSVRGNNPCA